MEGPARVFIADDHPIFREGLVRTIEHDRSFAVVGQAGDGAEALRCIQELHPDIAVLDVSMPTMDGIEVARRVHQEALLTEIVILTMYKEAKYFNAALDLGVRGYIVKDSVASELLTCLHSVTAGNYHISPVVSHLLLERSGKAVSASDHRVLKDLLTPAELTVLRLVAENKTNKEIGEALFVGLRTVENHRAHICQKLGIKGHNRLLMYAVKHREEL
jgi:DNA-binding NarL/FixJ family response regulator